MKTQTRHTPSAMLIFSALGAIFFLSAGAFAAPVAPTTVATYYTTPNTGYYYAGEPITFDGSGSHENDLINSGYTPQWVWDFNYSGNWTADSKTTTTSSTINYPYSEDGTYKVAVIYYSDDNLAGNMVVMTITIGPRTTYYYLKDHLGSVRMTIDAKGNMASFDNYYPFGETMPGLSSNTAIADAKYKFTGKERDVETGLDYFGARYYESWSGRWMSVDPLAFENPDMSPYQYSHDNPITRLDINGLSDLNFNEATETLTLYDKNGKEVGSWKASNRAFGKKGVLQHGGHLDPGTYPFLSRSAPFVDHKHTTENGSIGPYGIFFLKPFKDHLGVEHSYVGVHSGRADKGGWKHATDGCVRTTDAAMKAIKQLAKTDPLRNLRVVNPNNSKQKQMKRRTKQSQAGT